MIEIDVFKALSNEKRLEILKWLKEPKKHFVNEETGLDVVTVGVCVGEIQKKSGLTQSTTSQYLSLLQQSGLVISTRIGKWTYYRRNAEFIEKLSLFFQEEI